MNNTASADRYWSGFFTGLAAVPVLTLFAIALYLGPSLRATYLEFGGQRSGLSRLVLHPAWSWACLAACAGGIIAGNTATSPRRQVWIIAAAALVGSLLVAFTLWACYVPLFQVAGAIR